MNKKSNGVDTGLTGIICAVDTEAKPFIDALKDTSITEHAMLQFCQGTINNIRVMIVVSGICKVNAAVAVQLTISMFNVSRVIFSGTAGGIDGRLKIGDTVILTESVYHDVDKKIIADKHPRMKSPFFKCDANLLDICRAALEKYPPEQAVYYGRGVTGEAFIIDEGRKRIIEKYEPLCVDMETAAAAHVCYVNGVPFLAVRSVTDTENEPGFGSFYANVKKASVNSFNIIMKVLEEGERLA